MAPFTHVVTNKSGEVHAHKSDKRAKVEHLRAESITDNESSTESDQSHKDYVVARHVAFRIHHAEK